MKPEEALELVNFLNLNEAESLEEAKEKFQESWVNSKELSDKLGKINGTIAHVAKRAFEPFGVTLTEEDFKDKKAQDVLRMASERAREAYEKQQEEWQQRADKSGSEELIKEWEKKHKSLERKLTEVDTARQEAINQFEQFKQKMAEEQKQSKISHTFERELSAIKLDPSVNEFTIKGFKATIGEKYAIELEDDGNIFVKDKKSGERLKSKEKAGAFLNLSDVLLAEATAAGIIQKNPAAGQRIARAGQAIIPPLESQADKRIKGVNPRFFSK
jgi:predicted RNase H-like nuclease (RuvC/YqgF family)